MYCTACDSCLHGWHLHFNKLRDEKRQKQQILWVSLLHSPFLQTGAVSLWRSLHIPAAGPQMPSGLGGEQRDRGWSENFYIGNFNNFPNPKSMPGARPVCLPLHLTAGSQERSILKTSCKNNLALQRKLGTCFLCAHDAGGCNSKHTAAGSAPDLSLSYKFSTISALHQTHQLTAVIMIISPLRRNVEEHGLTLTWELFEVLMWLRCTNKIIKEEKTTTKIKDEFNFLTNLLT